MFFKRRDLMVEKIDFVVTWVDGSDPLWQEKKSKYDGSVNTSKKSMNSVKAYREWGTFKYWFRGVEKFAPWVNKVYLVTDQQKPSWIDIDSDKLVLVDHTEIIRNDYLPVFSANPIESNIHRIPGLSEHFVFFNDDVYLTAPVEPTDFFSEGGLPKYNTALSPIVPQPYGTAHFQVNDMEIVNSYFSKDEILKNGKFLSLKQGWKNIIKTLLYRNTKFICGFWENHLAHPLLKSTMELVWGKETAILEKTSASRFRNPSDTNVWLFNFWKLLNSEKYKIMCINDSLNVKDEEQVMTDFIKAMEELFPEKSSFEL